jgi:hypothetical protein
MGVGLQIKYLFIFTFIILAPASIWAQSIPQEKILYSNVEGDTLEMAFRTALEYYPELSDVKIRIKYGRIKTSMAAIPRPLSFFFHKRSHRVYTLIINKKEKKDAARLVHTAPFDAQVGLLGHELAHILDYTQKSNCQMVGFAIKYLNKEKRRQTEWKTDSLTVAHGLGWQLYRFSDFVMNQADISPKYRKYKTKYYMSPEALYEMVVMREVR